MLEKIEGRKKRVNQRIKWLDSIPMQWTWPWTNCGGWWGTGRPGMLQSLGLQSWTQLDDWITTTLKRTSQVVLVVKNLPANAGDAGYIPGLAKSPGGGHNNPLQYSYPENSMDRGVWQVTVHGITKSQIRLKLLNTHSRTITKINFCCEKIFIDSKTCLYGMFSAICSPKHVCLEERSQVRGTDKLKLNSLWLSYAYIGL